MLTNHEWRFYLKCLETILCQSEDFQQEQQQQQQEQQQQQQQNQD